MSERKTKKQKVEVPEHAYAILERYHNEVDEAVSHSNFDVLLPLGYDQECVTDRYTACCDKLSEPYLYFMGEVGWIATHLMYFPPTNYPIIDEENIIQCLDIMMHPKHWRITLDLDKKIPGIPPSSKPENEEQLQLYKRTFKNEDDDSSEEDEDHKKGEDSAVASSTKDEESTTNTNDGEKKKVDTAAALSDDDDRKHHAKMKINCTTNEGDDPDRIIREAANKAVYMRKYHGWYRPNVEFCGFTGKIYSGDISYDDEKDGEREKLHMYLSTMRDIKYREVFEHLTPNDKKQIDILLDGNPGYSDLPSILDESMSMTCTGSKEFDKAFPQPPMEFRLDACQCLPQITDQLLYAFGRIWFTHVLTPKAAAILTSAASAVLYKIHMTTPDRECECNITEAREQKGKEKKRQRVRRVQCVRRNKIPGAAVSAPPKHESDNE